ncbi:acyl-CoA dehydrogenase family protein [Chondromyces crocatus]|uniref:Acyl-CoA dehydrogenase n=1 Tax=Chondromyces crocatus TaxID=52 RepID=A0A0K1EU54_CHOCO|nr:acyl-CoA dehydrogenase [Chondromyces crocatus]AKT44153.1 acyl-CoA dehydrogenase [Chondromyces crocatus]
MDFDLSDEQRQLVETVQSFVKKQSPLSRLRAMREDPIGWSRDTWRQMGELGWLSISLPEAVGGLGGSFVDAALILEQLGATLVPEPMIPTLAAAAAVVRGGSEEQAARVLGPALAGEASLALAIAEAQSRFDVTDVGTRAVRSGSSYKLTGEKVWVLNGHAADHLVVSARTAGDPRDAAGVSLFVVPRDAAGLAVRSVKTMDGHHAAFLRFDGVEVGEEDRLGPEGGARDALSYAVDLGAAAACAEGLGVITTALHMTADYLKTREQFGVKIGSFQALQHRAVDMFVEAELCRSMMILAALKVDDADETERKSAISAAKVQLAWGGKQVTQQAIQLHGGIGVTDEHDIALYFKRMHVLNTVFGDEDTHLARFAQLPSFTAGVLS